ncbi:MAG: DUF4175 family protein [Hyphomonadaceae bacterium]
MKHQDALDLLARETQRARRRMGLERALRAGWWFLLALGVWALIALTGLHQRLPLLAQSLSAIAALIALAWLALRARYAWHAPSEEEARERLAADSKLDLAAFDALRDRPSRYDAFSVALWRREQDRAVERAETARAGPPRPRLDEFDPFKLRYLLAVALLAVGVLAGAAAPDRLAQAFLPDPGPLLGDQPMQIEAWAAPAAYTSASPISLSDRLGETVETPPSVEATVRVTGPMGAPVLVYRGEGGQRRVRFELALDGAWKRTWPSRARANRRSCVHTRASWRIASAATPPPRAAFIAPVATLNDETRAPLGACATISASAACAAARAR